jgi:DNA-binding FadR family transcriptional regulator
LLERYQVSRAVFREAVRLVEHHGVAGMRRGPGGGLVVHAPDAAAVTEAAAVYLEYAGTTTRHLMEARLLVEPLAASLAAERITEDGIQRLRSALDEEVATRETVLATGTTVRDLIGRHNDLHLVIAQIADNPAVELFVEVLTRLTGRYTPTPRRPPRAEMATTEDAISTAHTNIAAAVIAGNPGVAAHDTVGHLSAMADWFERVASASGTKGRSYPMSRDGIDPDRSSKPDKLGTIVASKIQAEITERGWPVGEVLGSEPELLQKYGEGRAAFREAVRLLEHHSVAVMRRGPGGGLVVCEPDPTAITEAMALYLEYRRVEIQDVSALRDALELGCVDIVTEHVTRRTAEMLEEALAVDESTPLDRVNVLGHDLHIRIAELTGNPVLSVFVKILTTLYAHHSGWPHRNAASLSPRDQALAVERTHRSIVDAIVAGDRGLARHRMLRHLQALVPFYST